MKHLYWLQWLNEMFSRRSREPERLPKLNADRAKRRESPYYRPQPFSDRYLRHLDKKP